MDLANWASRLQQNLPYGLNITSIRGFDQIRDPEIPISLRPKRNAGCSNNCDRTVLSELDMLKSDEFFLYQ